MVPEYAHGVSGQVFCIGAKLPERYLSPNVRSFHSGHEDIMPHTDEVHEALAVPLLATPLSAMFLTSVKPQKNSRRALGIW